MRLLWIRLLGLTRAESYLKQMFQESIAIKNGLSTGIAAVDGSPDAYLFTPKLNVTT